MPGEDPATTDALVAVADRGQTVTYRYTPVEHTIRMPARFRLVVTTRPDKFGTGRYRAANLPELCEIEITGGTATDAATPPERLLACRERVGRAAQLAPSRRIRAVAQAGAALDGRRQLESEDLAEADRLVYRGDRRSPPAAIPRPRYARASNTSTPATPGSHTTATTAPT